MPKPCVGGTPSGGSEPGFREPEGASSLGAHPAAETSAEGGRRLVDEFIEQNSQLSVVQNV